MSGTLQRAVALGASLVLLVAVGWIVLRPASQYRVTAYFAGTVGLYPGSDVRVLGIPIGTVTAITSLGDRVRVEMEIEDDYDIPADADAVVLAPSLVSDRYVQFAPVYDGGPTMEDGAEVPLEKTATPVELDQVYAALDELSVALGPTGANENGALSDLIDTGAANLQGNGAALNRTLQGFSQAVETLATNREDLFSSLENLQAFTTALATIDAQVSLFNDNMVATMDLLENERADLAEAVTLLSQALGDVAGFVQTNAALLTTNVDRLADVTLVLVQQRRALAEVLDVAPAALGNLARAYNPDYGTLDTRDNGLGSVNAEVVACGVLQELGRLQFPAGIDLNSPAELLGLPHTEAVCARLLSGDANNDRALDDLDGDGRPDLEQLWEELFGPGGAPAPAGLVGFPAAGNGGQG